MNKSDAVQYRQILSDIEHKVTNPKIRHLLRLWQDAPRSIGSLPDYQMFGPAALRWCSANLTVVEPVSHGDYQFIYYGDAMAAASGIDRTGSCLSDMETDIRWFFLEKYNLCAQLSDPVYTVHSAKEAMGVHTWERLILPVRSNCGKTVLVSYSEPQVYRHQFLESVLDSCEEGILFLHCINAPMDHSDDYEIWVSNPAAEHLLGIELLEGRESKLSKCISKKVFQDLCAVIDQTRATGSPGRAELLCVANEREVVLQTNAVISGNDVTITMHDITMLKEKQRELERLATDLEEENRQRRAAEQALKRLATTDELTGIRNRRELFRLADEMYEEARCTGEPFSVLLIDVDHFKSINDTFGHAAGDAVLKTLSSRIVEQLREHEPLGRIGGEEFALLMPGVTGGEALLAANRIRKLIAERPISFEDVKLSVSASVGLATLLSIDDKFEDLLKRADCAMYDAKAAGRDCVKAA